MAGELLYINPDTLMAVSNTMLSSLEEITSLRETISYQIQSIFDMLVPFEEIRGLFWQAQENFYNFTALATQLEEARIGAYRLNMVADLARSNMALLEQATSPTESVHTNGYLDWIWNTVDAAINEGETTLDASALAVDNITNVMVSNYDEVALNIKNQIAGSITNITNTIDSTINDESTAIIDNVVTDTIAIQETIGSNNIASEESLIEMHETIEIPSDITEAPIVASNAIDMMDNSLIDLNQELPLTVIPYFSKIEQQESNIPYTMTALDIYNEIEAQSDDIAIQTIGNNQLLVTIKGLSLSNSNTQLNDVAAGFGDKNNPYTREVEQDIQNYVSNHHLKNPQVTIAGHSIGGMIAEYLAGQQHGFKVTHVITFASPEAVSPKKGVIYDQYYVAGDLIPALEPNFHIGGNVHQNLSLPPSLIAGFTYNHTTAYYSVDNSIPILTVTQNGPITGFPEYTQSGVGVYSSLIYVENKLGITKAEDFLWPRIAVY